MTPQKYNLMSRAADAVRKLKDGKLATLTPQDLELVKSLLKDKDGYVEQAVAHNRTAAQAKWDIERCEWAVNKLTAPGPASPTTYDVCCHGKSPFEDCPECVSSPLSR